MLSKMKREKGVTEPVESPVMAAPKSPCVSVCALDDSDICIGCYRTGQEITDWRMADDTRKRDILAACADRRSAANTVKLC